MKSSVTARLSVVLLALGLAAAFAVSLTPRNAEAQSPGINKSAPALRTNDVPLPWTTVTAAANSNVLGYGNSSAYSPAAAVRLPYQQPMSIWVSFQCATVTLANVALVLQTSPDSNTWENVAGRTIVLNTGASAASANNTNVVLGTNLTAAQLSGGNWMRIASTTNGNAANLTSLRVQFANP